MFRVQLDDATKSILLSVHVDSGVIACGALELVTAELTELCAVRYDCMFRAELECGAEGCEGPLVLEEQRCEACMQRRRRRRPASRCLARFRRCTGASITASSPSTRSTSGWPRTSRRSCERRASPCGLSQ